MSVSKEKISTWDGLAPCSEASDILMFHICPILMMCWINNILALCTGLGFTPYAQMIGLSLSFLLPLCQDSLVLYASKGLNFYLNCPIQLIYKYQKYQCTSDFGNSAINFSANRTRLYIFNFLYLHVLLFWTEEIVKECNCLDTNCIWNWGWLKTDSSDFFFSFFCFLPFLKKTHTYTNIYAKFRFSFSWACTSGKFKKENCLFASRQLFPNVPSYNKNG